MWYHPHFVVNPWTFYSAGVAILRLASCKQLFAGSSAAKEKLIELKIACVLLAEPPYILVWGTLLNNKGGEIKSLANKDLIELLGTATTSFEPNFKVLVLRMGVHQRSLVSNCFMSGIREATKIKFKILPRPHFTVAQLKCSFLWSSAQVYLATPAIAAFQTWPRRWTYVKQYKFNGPK